MDRCRIYLLEEEESSSTKTSVRSRSASVLREQDKQLTLPYVFVCQPMHQYQIGFLE